MSVLQWGGRTIRLDLSFEKAKAVFGRMWSAPLGQTRNACCQCIGLAKGKGAGLHQNIHFCKNNGFLGKVNIRLYELTRLPWAERAVVLVSWKAMAVLFPLRDVGGHP